jgi:hypothetical protein
MGTSLCPRRHICNYADQYRVYNGNLEWETAGRVIRRHVDTSPTQNPQLDGACVQANSEAVNRFGGNAFQ